MDAKELLSAGLRLAFHKSQERQAQPPAPESFSCFIVRNASSGWLFASNIKGRNGYIVHSRMDLSATRPIILCVSHSNKQIGFLLAEDGQVVETQADLPSGSPVAVVIDPPCPTANTTVKLLHPINPSWQLGLSADKGRPDGAMIFAHRKPHSDCEFMLEEVEVSCLTLPVLRAAQQITANLHVPANGESLLRAVRGGVLRPDLAGAMLLCLSIDELAALALDLMKDKSLRSLIRSCLPHDPWLSERLDDLIGWERNRDSHSARGGTIAVSASDDLPGSGRGLAHAPKVGLALNALARRSIRPRRMACVVGSARNEGPYLLDWISHHRAIGFDHIFIYTNDNTDGSDELLKILGQAGVVTWFDNATAPECLPQFRAYAHALSILPDTLDYRWTLIADLDEYFSCDTGKFSSVTEYLAWQEVRRAEAIALPWLIYAASRDDVWRDASCTERFLKREAAVNPHIKSIFRSNLHWSSSCHNPLPMLEFPINYRSQNRTPHVLKQPENNQALAHNPQASHAWIAHYIFKSAPEVLMKIQRGKGDTAISDRHVDIARLAKPFVSLCDKSTLVHDARTLKFAQGALQELTRLREIPGVYACERSIKEKFAARMHAACTQFLREPPAKAETAECTAFRAILRRQSHNAVFSAAAA